MTPPLPAESSEPPAPSGLDHPGPPGAPQRRRVDALAFGSGLLCLGAVGLWLASRLLHLDTAVVAGLAVAGVLVVIGLAGLVQVLGSARRRHR